MDQQLYTITHENNLIVYNAEVMNGVEFSSDHPIEIEADMYMHY